MHRALNGIYLFFLHSQVLTVVLGLASASLADEADQWAPATYESTGPTAAAAAATAAAAAPGTEYNQQYHYPPAAEAHLLSGRADPAGNLRQASMFRSMRDSLADISHRVGRGFSSAMGLNQEAFQSGESTTRVRERD